MSNLKFGFSIKPSALKPKRAPSDNNKYLTKILYCVAVKDGNLWKAHINTKGVEGYEDLTILPFTEKSFNLKGRTDIFYLEKDKYNHYIHIMRNSFDAHINPGCSDLYCTLAENSVFSGHIVKIDGILQFDMSSYKGELYEYNYLIKDECIGDQTS